MIEETPNDHKPEYESIDIPITPGPPATDAEKQALAEALMEEERRRLAGELTWRHHRLSAARSCGLQEPSDLDRIERGMEGHR
jgi:hypothetical protein